MKIYFKTRDQARKMQSSNRKVVDSKNQPSKNGLRWAVQINKK